MFSGIKDVVLAIKLALDKGAAEKLKSEMQDALAKATDPKEAQKNLAEAESAVDKLTGKLEKLLVAVVAAFATKVVVMFVKDSVEAFVKFDQKLQQSVAIMGRMGDAMRKELGETAKKVAVELGMSAEEIVQGYYYLASAGLDAKQSILALPLAAAFAKAGLMDMKQATDFLTLAVSSLGYASKDPEKNLASMTRVADVLTYASKKSQATLEQMTAALTGKVSQSLRVFHKDVEEGAAALMVLADAGVRGTLASERLDIFMRQVSQAALHHTAAFKKYGIAIFDAKGHMRNFADISHDLTKALGRLSDRQMTLAMSELGIQQRTQASIKVFIGAEEALRRYEKMMGQAGGKTLEIADRMNDTPLGAWAKYKAAITNARMEIGEKWMPLLDEFMEQIQGGGEDDPHSVVGIMKQFAEGLENSRWLLNKLGFALGWLAREPLAAVVDAFNIIADMIVGPINYGLSALGGLFFAMGIASYSAAAGLGEFLKWIGMESAGSSVDNFARKLANLTTVIGKFTVDRAATGTDNFVDAFKRLASGFAAPPAKKPRLVDHKPNGKGGRDGNGGNDDDGGGGDDAADEKRRRAADRRKSQIDALNNSLDAMLAKHTQERVDDEMLKLKKIEDAYNKIYKGKIPLAVREALKSIKESIKAEGAANALMDAFKEEFKDGEDTPLEKIVGLHAFIDKAKDLKSKAKEGSKEWKIYTQIIEDATKLINKLADKAAKDGKANRDKIEKDAADAAEARIRKIGKITDHVAKNMARAWEVAFEKLTSGSRRGIDALHAMKDVALTAMTQPLAEYAANKTKAQFLEAGDDFAKGMSFLADPLTAGLAPGMFASAAKHALQGTAWAALAGGGQAAVGGFNSAASSVGNYNDSGRNKVDSSSPMGTEINIHVDGMDPKNPAHQKLLGDTLNEYAQRGGGNLRINTKR